MGEKPSYKVQMPIVREFCKENNTLKLFNAMHIATTIEAHKTSEDGLLNIFY
jgi:hypothetical protein